MTLVRRGQRRRSPSFGARPLRALSPIAVALASAIVAVAVSAPVASASERAHDRTSEAATQGSHSPKRSGRPARVHTFLGPYGVESSAVIAQNRLPGTTAWRIVGTPPGFIEGFANVTAARAGQDVTLYVSTNAARFRVDAFRMGWYGGDGARLVWRSPSVPGRVQPPCPVISATRTVICDNWSASLRLKVTKRWFPGDYLLELVGSGGQRSYVLLTVWDPASHATYLLVARSMTEEGWNSYGGYDFYQGTGACPPGAPSYPPCNRALVVSFDRPYASGNGSSDFLSNEFPLVEFAERHGLDVTYTTDVVLDQHPNTVLDHRAVLSLGHDETWTAPELFAVENAVARGINVVFFGAAALVRHARLQSSPMGPDTEVVDYRDSALDPLDGHGSPWDVTGNTWASPPTNWPESSFVGEAYSGYFDPGAGPVPFVVWDPVHWLFKGTGLTAGSSIPGVVDSDIDHVAAGEPTPQDLQVLGHSPVPLRIAYTNQGQWGSDTYSDMTYYTDPTSGAGVLDTGTTNWICALSLCAQGPAAAATLQKVTGNLLHLFGQGPAGKRHPSIANLQTVVPAGS